MPEQPVVVIGAGVAGLAAAVRLQARGVPTILLDRNATPGGKLNIIEADGYRFDTGPSLLTMPAVFEELFAAAGLDFHSLLRVVPLDPYCRYFFPDGEVLDTSDSMQRMSETLLRLAPDDVEAFFAFLAKAARWYRMSVDTVIYGPPLDWKTMRGSKLDPVAFFRMRPFERLEHFVDRTFRDERIRRIARLIALYTGCAPDRAPAIFALIPFLEFGLGRWYVQGGLYGIAARLIERYGELGGDYRPLTTVTSVRFVSGRATEAVTSDGVVIPGRHFIVNADVALAAETFLRDAPGAARMRSRLGKLRISTSAFVLMIGTRADAARLIHHNLLFSRNERLEWEEVFGRGVVPADPTIYLNNPSFSDPSLAPPGGSALFAMVNVPAGAVADWDAYAELVLARVERYVPGLRANIDTLHRLTPDDFRERTFADRGSLYGRAPDSLRAMMLRPKNREPGFDGVSFAGGTTHPGAGIPLAALSGKLVAEMVLSS